VWGLAAAAAGGAVRRREDRVNLLLHLGATDPMIVRPFRARAAGAAAIGAVVGAGAAAALASAAIWSPTAADWINAQVTAQVGASPSLDAWDLAAVVIWPPVAVLAAALAAGAAAKSRLRVLA
jgi:cell division protein FtsX